jgi:hypothetical protein
MQLYVLIMMCLLTAKSFLGLLIAIDEDETSEAVINFLIMIASIVGVVFQAYSL